MSDTLFPRDLVQEVYGELARAFDPRPAWLWNGQPTDKAQICPHALADRMCAVGGFRRQKREMKDLEILFIPRVRTEPDPGDMFGATRNVDVTAALLEQLLQEGVIAKRLNTNSHETWGPWNKHARHVATGLPLDFFTATHENYFNRLVVTTGPADLKVRIATAAHALGFDWKTADAGFVPIGGTWETSTKERRAMRSEAAVFEFVNLPHMRPEARK